MKYPLSLLIACFLTSLAIAQPGMMRMEPMPKPVAHGPYKDSVQFKAEFNALYPLIRPTPNIRERAKIMLARMTPMLKARGIDSVTAYDTAMKALDPVMDKQILFDAYRAEFSAEELKPLTAFFKTPAGKHYLEVETPLIAARDRDIEQYIAQTMYRAIMPMMKPMPTHLEGARPRPPMGRPGMPGGVPQAPDIAPKQ
jgi:hypothetical protein